MSDLRRCPVHGPVVPEGLPCPECHDFDPEEVDE